jgi:hypothetical protein
VSEERSDVLEGLERYQPGPWRKIRRPLNGNDDYWEIAWSDDGELVADGVYGENVDLIARAPELADEIRRLREESGRLRAILSECAKQLAVMGGADGHVRMARALLESTP